MRKRPIQLDYGEDSPATLPFVLPIPGCDEITDHFDIEVGDYRLEIDYYSPAAADRALARRGQQLRTAPDGSIFVFRASTVAANSSRLAIGLIAVGL